MTVAACAPQPQPAPEAPGAWPDGEIVDLSHVYDETTVFWPTADRFRLDVVADGMTPGGYHYAANNVFTSEHGGTHLDAPVHSPHGKLRTDRSSPTRSCSCGSGGPLRAIAIVNEEQGRR